MITKMIVNRIDDWFHVEDLELDDCLVAMNLLVRLSTRQKAGFKYDRVKLSSVILNRNSVEAVNVFDKAIVILFSRRLITFEEGNYGDKRILITTAGLKVVEDYKELIKDVD